MAEQKTREKLEAELYRLTGLHLTGESGEDPAETVKKLQRVLEAYREKNGRREFLRKLLSGQLERDISLEAVRLHIPAEGRWCILVIETEEPGNSTASDILRQMFTSGGTDYAVMMDARRITLVHFLKAREGREKVEELAHTVVDMLNTEGMLRARAAFGPIAESLESFPKIYSEAATALEIGRIFYSHETVISYDHLGIGRLVYRLPEDVCRRFLAEVIGDRNVQEIDPDILVAVDTFFENNLNVSETARQLYIHRNTLIYRLEKLRQITGLDIRVFEDAMTYRIASMVASYLHDRMKQP